MKNSRIEPVRWFVVCCVFRGKDAIFLEKNHFPNGLVINFCTRREKYNAIFNFNKDSMSRALGNGFSLELT